MSATVLRDNARAKIQKAINDQTTQILNDRDSSAEHLHDMIGYARGLSMAIEVLNTEYAELHR